MHSGYSGLMSIHTKRCPPQAFTNKRVLLQAVHSGYSGLMSMLIAADVLSTQQRGGGAAPLTHDIIFVSYTAESVGLTGSRRLLFELDRGANSTAGIELGRVAAIIEVGMTGALEVDGESQLFTHAVTEASAAGDSLVAASAAVANLSVRSRRPHLRPDCLCTACVQFGRSLGAVCAARAGCLRTR